MQRGRKGEGKTETKIEKQHMNNNKKREKVKSQKQKGDTYGGFFRFWLKPCPFSLFRGDCGSSFTKRGGGTGLSRRFSLRVGLMLKRGTKKELGAERKG